MHKIANFIVKYKYEILLTLFSFILLYYFRKSFMMNWDAFVYIEKIYLHIRSNLLLGRPGFVYFFIAIWDILRTLFNLSIFEFHHVVRLFNIAFGSLTVLFLYLTVKKILKNEPIAIGSALIFLFSRDFISYNSDILTEPMMLFFVILSFYFFTLAFETKKPLHLYISAFLFGYAFEVHEPALFFILFFPAYYIYKKARLKTFSSKNYCVFAAIMLIVALFGPLIIYLNEGNQYIEGIFYHLSADKSLTASNFISSSLTASNLINSSLTVSNIFSSSFLLFTGRAAYAGHMLKGGFSSPSLLLALFGVVVLLFKKRYKDLLIVLSLFVPVLIFTFGVVGGPRHFISGYFALSILVSIFLFYLTSGICRNLGMQQDIYRKHIFFLFLFILLCSNFINFQGLLIGEVKHTQDLEHYGLNLTKAFPAENTVFLLGEKSPLVAYYIVLSNSKQRIISTGWSWPGQKLNEIMMDYLSKNKTIVVDTNLDHFNTKESKDMEQLINSYELENASMGLSIIRGPKS